MNARASWHGQLSPDLVEARAMLVSVFTITWDWAAAETEAQRAVAIDPTNATVLQAAGYLALVRGRWDDAERQLRAALARDPLNRFSIQSLGELCYRTGRYAEAELMYRKELALAPGTVSIHNIIGAALLQQGKAEAALAMVQQEPEEGYPLYYLPIMLQANGRMAEADEALKALIAQWTGRGSVPYSRELRVSRRSRSCTAMARTRLPAEGC
jgi:Tfp pilus assembly protein PilF